LTLLRGFDPNDLSTAVALGATEARPLTDHLADGVTAVRIGVLRDLFRQDREFGPANALVNGAIARLRPLVTVVDDLTTGLDLISQIPTLRVNNYELRFAFDAYLQRRGPASPVRSLAALIATGKYLKTLESPYAEAMRVESLDSHPDYLAALARQRTVNHALLQLMDRERVDALVYPMKSQPAPLVGTGERGGAGDNPISSIAGLPCGGAGR
jgi:Asp-tRNA(Asn)/Glu-tRNA(Gln) amidotransferase A subunit family amidase